MKLSPDERYAAVSQRDPLTRARDIWLFDMMRKIPQRFTFETTDEIRPVWSPDSKFLAFGRAVGAGLDRAVAQGLDIYRKGTGASGPEELLYKSASPLDWSSDGRHILFLKRGQGPDSDIWPLNVDDRQARPYLTSPFNEIAGAFSPDGRWVAYLSNETGALELYVAGFPDPRSKRAGVHRWRGDHAEVEERHPGVVLRYARGERGRRHGRWARARARDRPNATIV